MAMLGKRRPALTKPDASRTPRRVADRTVDAAADGGVSILRLAHDGRGVARSVEGKTLFVDGALPGERVEIAIHRQRRRFDEAHVRRRLHDAPERVAPPCEYADRCGGCDLQHLALDAQRAHKQRVLRELLSRQGVPVAEPVALLAGADAGYRRRARLGVKPGGRGEIHLGFRARGSEQLVDIDHCHVLARPLSALLPRLRAVLASLAVPRHVGHVELLLADDQRPTVVIRQLRPVPEDAARWRDFAEREGLDLALLVGRDAPRLEWQGAQPTLTSKVRAAAGAVTLGFAPGDFLQVNADINQRLIDTARDWLAPMGDERLLDLFAGIGNFALALAPSVARVTAVEGSSEMVERLRDNATRNGLDAVTALQADLSAPGGSLATVLNDHDLVVLDPPRDGADAVARMLARSSVDRVLYVSCDPASLARDAVHMIEGGFVLERLAVADMFPHTAHLESLALFRRRRASGRVNAANAGGKP